MTTPKRAELRRELDAIAKTRAGLTPKSVLQAAKNKSSILHKFFEWDDTEAARLYREKQAAGLIRTVTASITTPEHREIEVRAFINVRDEDNEGCINYGDSGKYVPISVALENDSYRSQLLSAARRDLTAFRTKYACLIELAGVFREIESLEAA